MGYREDLNSYLSQNPGDADHARFDAEQIAQMQTPSGDPLIQGGADPGTQAPAPAYGGLTGDPYQTAVVTSAQLTALRPKRRGPRPAPVVAPPVAGLSQYLGGGA